MTNSHPNPPVYDKETRSRMSKKNALPGQQALPGINAKKYAYDALLNDNPTPNTLAEAERFFRRRCDVLIKQKQDHDFLRVVLKDKDNKAETEKHEFSRELDIYDRKKWEANYIDVAQRVHAYWLDIEGPKYDTPSASN